MKTSRATGSTRHLRSESPSADFQVCCIAGFQTRVPHDTTSHADLEIGDTAGLETCATSGGVLENGDSAGTLIPQLSPLNTQLQKRAFTLIEVMIAMGIFFIAIFAILGVMSNCLRNARALQMKTVDAGMVAAEYTALTNVVEEGLESGDFGDDYPGYTWTRDAYEAGSNGLWQVDIIVQRPNGVVESKMSIFRFSPQSQSSSMPRSPFGAGASFR